MIVGRNGRVRAFIDPRGASLRRLVVRGQDLVETYPVGQAAPGAAGATLFPWPNRVRDGRWSGGGLEHQLPVDEPERRTALHGLVWRRSFDRLDPSPGRSDSDRGGRSPGRRWDHGDGSRPRPGRRQRDDRLVLGVRLDRPPGYPFTVALSLTYQVIADGLAVGAETVNLGTEPAPVALGFHPYLRLGRLTADQLTLDVSADLALDFDDRLLPVGQHAVAESGPDPAGLPLAGTSLNHCFGGLRPERGRFRHRLLGPDQDGLELSADLAFRWVQVYTWPDFPRSGQPVPAVAVEPMTAPPDALNSGRDLVWLAPGKRWRAGWSLRRLPRRRAGPDHGRMCPTTESALAGESRSEPGTDPQR
jgi:aldose 1-epimerase